MYVSYAVLAIGASISNTQNYAIVKENEVYFFVLCSRRGRRKRWWRVKPFLFWYGVLDITFLIIREDRGEAMTNNAIKISEQGTPPEKPGRMPFTFARYTVASERHGERNEDHILVDQSRGLAGVFDGVGGSISGEVASRMAAYVIRRGWKQVLLRTQGHLSGILEGADPLDLCATLQHLLVEANEQICTKGWKRATRGGVQIETGGPATTAVVATLCQQDGGGYIMTYAHVGDSRIYLLRGDDPLAPLTRDDGYLSTLLRDHLIVEEDILRIDQTTEPEQLSEIELSYFEKRNGITQALGDSQTPTIHCDQIALEPADRILLCSDGIHDNLTNREMEAILRKGARTTVARDLVQQAIERSQQDTLRAKADDMSAVVITCHF